MKTLLGLVLRNKQFERYDIFNSMDKMKRMLKNDRFCLDIFKSQLAHTESHIPCEYDGMDLMDPIGSSARPLAIISSFENGEKMHLVERWHGESSHYILVG